MQYRPVAKGAPRVRPLGCPVLCVLVPCLHRGVHTALLLCASSLLLRPAPYAVHYY